MTANQLLKPRDYQLECIRAIHTRWDAGLFRPASVLPTGAGKTVVFSHLAEEYLTANPGKRVLVLSHTDELVQQAANKMRQVAPHRTVGIVKAERSEVTAQVVSASVQSLRHPKRRNALRNVGLIIVDECHHAVAPTYRKVLEHFGALPAKCSECNGSGHSGDSAVPGGQCWDCRGSGFYNGGQVTCRVAGFTATLVRGDKAKLAEVWEDVAYRKDIAFMIRRGYLLDVKGRRVVVPDLDLGRVKTSGGDYREGSLGEELERAMAPEVVAKAYVEHAGDRKGLVFAPTVESAYAFAEAFQDEGIKAEVVHGALARDERRAILTRLREGTTQVVANCMVLTEGFDEPSVSCAVIARPTKSSGLYQQMVGRVLRPDLTLPQAERGHALILDVVGISTRHDLRSLVDLSSREDLEDRDLDEELSLLELEDLELVDEGLGDGGPVVDAYYAGPVDVEDFDPLARDSSQMWGRTPDGLYWMTAGVARYVFLCPSLEGDPGTYDVVWCSKPDPQTRDRGEQQILREHFSDKVYAGQTEHRGLTFEMALSWAEEAAEELAGAGLKTFARKGTKWRKEAPTDGQKWKARTVGVEIPEGISKGDLSHLIDTVLAGRRVDALVRTVLAARQK
jgi:superfamily II DNA or RNA helicase